MVSPLDEGVSKYVKIILSLVFIAVVISLALGVGHKLYSGTKTLGNSSITQVSVNIIGGSCAGIGASAPVYDYSTPQPGVPVNITIRVSPVGSPVSTLVITNAKVKITSQSGQVVAEKSFGTIKGGVISFLQTFYSPGSYGVYVSVTTNYGSVYDKPVGTVVIGGVLTEGRLPVEENFTLKVPTRALIPRNVNIIPDTEYLSAQNGVINVYVPLVSYTTGTAEEISSAIAKRVFVRLVEDNVPLLNALSTSKYVYTLIYKYLVGTPAGGGFAVVRPGISVVETVGGNFLPEFTVSPYLEGRVSYEALMVSVKYSGYVNRVDYRVVNVHGTIKYPAVVSLYSVYLDGKDILDFSDGKADAKADFIKVIATSGNNVTFALTRPASGEMLVYYQMPYQTPGEADAPVIIDNETVYTVSVPLSYSFTTLQGVEKVASLTVLDSPVGSRITLYFTEKDLEGKTLKEAVMDKLSLLSSSLNITDKGLLQKVENAVKVQLSKGKLGYSITVSPVLELVRTGDRSYYKPVVEVEYHIEAVRVDVSFSSKAVVTENNTYPLSIPVASVSSSRVSFSGKLELDVSPESVHTNPTPGVENGLLTFPPNTTKVTVWIDKGTNLTTVELPSITLNGKTVYTGKITVTGDGKKTTLKLPASVPVEVLSETDVLSNGFVLELVKTKKVLSSNTNFPNTISYFSPSSAHLFGDYYIVSRDAPVSNRTFMVLVSGITATDSPLYPSWVFTGVKTPITIYFPGGKTPESVAILTADGTTVASISNSVVTSSHGVSVSGVSTFSGEMSFNLLVTNTSVSELVIEASGNNWTSTAIISVLKAPYLVFYQPLFGSLQFLKGNDLAIKVTPLYGGSTVGSLKVTVDNYIPEDYYEYLDDIISPSPSSIVPGNGENVSGEVNVSGGSLYVGVTENYTFVKRGSVDGAINVYLIPLKAVKILFSSPDAYLPDITLDVSPAVVKAEYNTTRNTVYTFEDYSTRFKPYIEYTTENGTAKAYIFTKSVGVVLETKTTSVTLDPASYTVYRDGEYTVLKVSSFPLPVSSPTAVTVKAVVSTPLFSGEPTVATFTLKPATSIRNLLIVPNEYYKPFYSFNDVSAVNSTISDPNGGTVTVRMYDGRLIIFTPSEYRVLVIDNDVSELYLPYPSYNPFKEGITLIGIPLPSGNSIMSVKELKDSVSEIDITYTTDYLTKTFEIKDVSSYIKVLKAGSEKYGLIVVPIDPLVASSIVTNPIGLNVVIKFKNGGEYSSSYIIQPVLSAYTFYQLYTRYAYILTVHVSQNTPKLYFSRLTGRLGKSVDFIGNTVLHEADPTKKSYDELVSHLKPFSTPDEEWLFSTTTNYEQLTIKPNLAGGYFPIDYPNEVYVFRTSYGFTVAFYIGGGAQLNFQMKYSPANFTLDDILKLIASGKLKPSYEKSIQTKDADFTVKLWFFIPSDGGSYVYVSVSNGKSSSSKFFKVSGFGFSFVYDNYKFTVCWAFLTNSVVRGLVVSVSR